MHRSWWYVPTNKDGEKQRVWYVSPTIHNSETRKHIITHTESWSVRCLQFIIRLRYLDFRRTSVTILSLPIRLISYTDWDDILLRPTIPTPSVDCCHEGRGKWGLLHFGHRLVANFVQKRRDFFLFGSGTGRVVAGSLPVGCHISCLVRISRFESDMVMVFFCLLNSCGELRTVNWTSDLRESSPV